MDLFRICTATQVAALEWDADNSSTQDDARKALSALLECQNELARVRQRMQRATEQTRHQTKKGT
jgi:exonuclease VII small subunit